jgi:histone acetyltransferase (RNA polymerase elongator complex component)
MTDRPFIIPFFLKQSGCPHRCVYCDQSASGGHRASALTPESVRQGIQDGLSSRRLSADQPVEIAFFGGTFTGLPQKRQADLLAAVESFVLDGRVNGIRLSTRPDYLDKDMVGFLETHHVTVIEIGVQSMDNKALISSSRGYTAKTVLDASQAVRDAGLTLGWQLMPGLPGEDDTGRDTTISHTLAVRPDQVRIYPLLVLKQTPLAAMYEKGDYRPLILDEAIQITADMYEAFTSVGIKIIRMGLHNESGLEDHVLAGPMHPAFGHLVKGEIYYRSLHRAITRFPSIGSSPEIRCAPNDIPLVVGHERSNIQRLETATGSDRLKIKADKALPTGRFVWQGKAMDAFPINKEVTL